MAQAPGMEPVVRMWRGHRKTAPAADRAGPEIRLPTDHRLVADGPAGPASLDTSRDRACCGERLGGGHQLTIQTPRQPGPRRRCGVSPSPSRRAAKVRPSSPARPCTPTTWCSRAPGTARRSARPTPTPRCSRSSSTRRSTGRRVVVVTADGHPGRQRRRAHQRRPADPRPGRRRDPAPGRAGRADRRPGPRDAARGEAPGHAPDRAAARRSSTRSSPTHVFAHYELARGRRRRGSRRGRRRRRGRRTASATRSSCTSRTTR